MTDFLCQRFHCKMTLEACVLYRKGHKLECKGCKQGEREQETMNPNPVNPLNQRPISGLITTQEILQKTGLTKSRFHYHRKKYSLSKPVKVVSLGQGSGKMGYYDRSILGQIEQLLKTKRPYRKREQKEINHRGHREPQRLKQEGIDEGQGNVPDILAEMRADIAWIKDKLQHPLVLSCDLCEGKAK